MADAQDWERYYASSSGRPPRPHLRAALPHVRRAVRAIDLGAGDGVDSRFLLSEGWRVVAVDATPGLRDRILAGAPIDSAARLDARDLMFADVVDLPRADLVLASYSLPFADEREFSHIWSLVRASLDGGGVFAGQLFGEQDDWASRDDVLTHTADDVRVLLSEWDVIELTEHRRDGVSGRGPKHWHVYDIIARHA